VRNAFLYQIYSGQLFLAVALFMPIAVIAGEHPSARRAARFLGLLAIGLGVLSAPPLPLIVAIPTAAACLAWVFLDRWTNVRRIAGVIAGIGCIVAVVMEIPAVLQRTAVPRPSRVFVIGDSLSSGGFGEQTPWPGVLQTIATLPVTNLSLASGDSATALQRQIPLLPRPADGRECVVIEIGGIDMLDGVDPDRFAANLEAILTAVRERHVVMLEMPLLPGRWSYGAAQRRLARKHECTLVPKRVLAGVLLTAGNTSDGIHLTQRGHDALAQRLMKSLEWDVRP
jgi:acyl-CoA thioesterase-1